MLQRPFYRKMSPSVGAVCVSRATWFTDCATTWFTHLLLDRFLLSKLFSVYRHDLQDQFGLS